MAVIAIGRDDLIALLDRRLHADDDRLLTDIEMAKATDEAHAVELARPLLEAADEQHVAIELDERVLAQRFSRRRPGGFPA